MIIKLKNADFSANNIGTLSTWTVTRVLGGGATYNGLLYVDKNAALNATVTISDGYELGDAGVTVTMGGEALTSGVTVDGNTITIAIDSVTGNVVIKVPTVNTSTDEGDEPSTGGGDNGNEDDEPSTGGGDNGNEGGTPISVTWKQGAIDTSYGTDNNMMANRLRTQDYIRVNSSITISASGNAEFCPVYYDKSKTFISSPSAYQTSDLTVSGSEYPVVRIMIRDKSDTSAIMTPEFGENYMTITGDGMEIYDNGIHDGATWNVGAIDTSTGKIAKEYTTRIHTGYIPLVGSVTVSVSGTAEFCPILYDSFEVLKSTPAAYQTTSQTFTSADGAYLVLMARNSAATTTNLTTDYGNNISITIE